MAPKPFTGKIKKKDHLILFWTLFDQLVVSGTSFVVTVIVARLIGVEDFGAFSIAVLVILLAQNLQAAMLIAPMMSNYPRISRFRRRSYERAVFEHSVVGTGIAIAVVTFIMASAKLLFQGSFGIGLAPLAFSLAANLSYDYSRRSAFARGAPKAAAAIDVIRSVAMAAIFGGWPLVSSASGAPLAPIQDADSALWAFGAAVLPSAAYGIVSMKLGRRRPSVSRYAFWKHSSYSLWMAAQALLQYASSNAQFLIVGHYLSVAAIGVLRAAMNLSNVVNLFVLAVENWAPVNMAQNLHRDGSESLKRSVWTINLALLCFFAPFLLLSFLYGRAILVQIYGVEYDTPQNILFAWMLVNYASSVQVVFRSAYRSVGMPRILVQVQALTLVAVLALTVLLVPLHGLTGGPLALFFALMGSNCILLLALPRALRVPVSASM